MTQRRARLDGLKAIAAHLDLSVRQVQRLASKERPARYRLPTFRLSDDRCAVIYAWQDEVDDWQMRVCEAFSSVPDREDQ